MGFTSWIFDKINSIPLTSIMNALMDFGLLRTHFCHHQSVEIRTEEKFAFIVNQISGEATERERGGEGEETERGRERASSLH